MTPAPGERLLRHVGDRVAVRIACPAGQDPSSLQARLRTNLGRGSVARDEIIASLAGKGTFAGMSWRDIPLQRDADGWAIDLPLTEVGWFSAKPYLIDTEGHQHWPAGDDLGITVHPDAYRTSNTIYCAFTRMFGASRERIATREPLNDEQFSVLDRHGYTIIPPSGRLRDLTATLPHIIGRLGCSILHLLPVGPTPTTYARFGRYGSPYACEDLTAIDPALVEFDKRTTGVDQFRELTGAAHLLGGQVFLDIVINHTGWGSTLQNDHPEWFRRNPDGSFHSPGAWGNTWEDLVELETGHHAALWDVIADSLVEWCRRGVDGFRCDAGYMVPLPAWRYIIARVRLVFPDSIFLLEGLGGAWQATADLLTAGGMQWAYSELFQNHQPGEIARYLDHCARTVNLGVLVHYSETHDNNRLAANGRAWSLLRNRLCALTSQQGAFGFTAGVEWLASEKLEVHHSRGMRWGAEDNICNELAQLNKLLAGHPCFFDGAVIERLSPLDAPVFAAVRRAADGERVLIIANTDLVNEHTLSLTIGVWNDLGQPGLDLLGQTVPSVQEQDGMVHLTIGPAGAWCLGTAMVNHGASYRAARARAAWAYRCLAAALPIEDLGPADWRALSALVDADPPRFLAAIPLLDRSAARSDLIAALGDAIRLVGEDGPARVVEIDHRDLNRVVPVPPGCWLVIRDGNRFRATLQRDAGHPALVDAIPANGAHWAAFPPAFDPGPAHLDLAYHRAEGRVASCAVRFLGEEPDLGMHDPEHGVALLTNGLGGMARIRIDLGAVASKYDCLLGANLHASAPVDRHVLAKRVRAWVCADGFITALDASNLSTFTPGPPARWRFVAKAGDGRTLRIDLVADMIPGRNATVLRLTRTAQVPPWGRQLTATAQVRVIVRIDLEDRSFHAETKRWDGADGWFSHATTSNDSGFTFAPASDRRVVARIEPGVFHPEPEWCLGIAHPIEAERGMTDRGDAWSPGWFEADLATGSFATVVVDADPEPLPPLRGMLNARIKSRDAAIASASLVEGDAFGRALVTALQAFIVRRGQGRTVIAGYPWFLDWGRDTFIAARGMLAAGMEDAVLDLLRVFGRFEEGGTLPNLLHGDGASNRDTSDAPLWYAVVAGDLAAQRGDSVLDETVSGGGRSLRSVLLSIASGYLRGTANGIKVDTDSGLVWSPPHFTWMDTNYPACTPRTGYPIEIQALWIRLLRLLQRLDCPPTEAGPWWILADRATRTLDRYWLADKGWFADVLSAPPGVLAAHAAADDALRPNQLLAVTLGVLTGARAQAAVQACRRWLLIPGALRSLAPLTVDLPLTIIDRHGHVVGDPHRPYRGRYSGDEDTQRKPSYHNGTGWTWLLPVFCEALAEAWNWQPDAVSMARTYMTSMGPLMGSGCIGHLPENLDGDAPHAHKGCDAQAWSTSESLRVWVRLRHH